MAHIRGQDLTLSRAGPVSADPRPCRERPYQVQAAITAIHSDATTAVETDRRQIMQLYGVEGNSGGLSVRTRDGRRARA